jgi:hypothetical protein
MDDPVNLCIFFALACLAAYLVQNYVGEIAYFLTAKWRESLFLGMCALIGALSALHMNSIGREITLLPKIAFANDMSVPSDIAICRKFVKAQLHGDAYMPEGLSHGLISFGPIDPWESCARTFGMNYWNHDISVEGQSGGRLLCEIYNKRQEEPSDKVESWCNSVFAGQPGKAAKNQRI